MSENPSALKIGHQSARQLIHLFADTFSETDYKGNCINTVVLVPYESILNESTHVIDYSLKAAIEDVIGNSSGCYQL